jgi:hypothetical protein
MQQCGRQQSEVRTGAKSVSYEITHPNDIHTIVTRTDNPSVMDVDTNADTIEFVGMDYFTASPGSTIIQSMILLNDEGRGVQSACRRDEQ